MPQLKTKGRATRLDLANWLCSEDNPMAARAFMNRLWALYFGDGLSVVQEDLGSQGELPINPELLDYLARHFMDKKWDIKAMVKAIVMTETYRLSTKRVDGNQSIDPYNRYLSRQSVIRLNAEFIRDTALQVSGLLNNQFGGRNIMPYQPSGYYASMNFNPFRYKPETTDQQFRRSVYMHWQRTFLHPFLKNFDAPEREVSICKRPSSNTPQQALTLLNDPSFVEAAKVLAQRIIKEGGKSTEQRLGWLYEEALGRSIQSSEKAVLKSLYDKQLAHFTKDKTAAGQLLSTGISKLDQKINVSEAAAWTQVARAILNTHEFIIRR